MKSKWETDMQVVRDRQTNRDTGSEPDRQADTDRQQFSSVQDVIYALEKVHNYAFHPVSQNCPQF